MTPKFRKTRLAAEEHALAVKRECARRLGVEFKPTPSKPSPKRPSVFDITHETYEDVQRLVVRLRTLVGDMDKLLAREAKITDFRYSVTVERNGEPDGWMSSEHPAVDMLAKWVRNLDRSILEADVPGDERPADEIAVAAMMDRLVTVAQKKPKPTFEERVSRVTWSYLLNAEHIPHERKKRAGGTIPKTVEESIRDARKTVKARLKSRPHW